MGTLPGIQPNEASNKLALSLEGILWGGILGDALGLSSEGLSSRRATAIFGDTFPRPLLGKFLFHSDDGEHLALLAEALAESGDDSEEFENMLARKLRWWLLTLPPGVGFATLRSLIKSWLGFPPAHSGVFSAGNGPAMRSAPLGPLFGANPTELKFWVQAATRLTHSDPMAAGGAFAVALAAYLSATVPKPENIKDLYFQTLFPFFISGEWKPLRGFLAPVPDSLELNGPELLALLNIGPGGPSGFIGHTLPIVLHQWLTHSDNWADAVRSTIALGGDCDTTASIVGAMVGARVGLAGIPVALRESLFPSPLTAKTITALATYLGGPMNSKYPYDGPRIAFWKILLYHLLQIPLVLGHGVRRLLPPY